jgi:ferredoxin
MNTQWMPQIDHEKCTGCSDCVAICPTDALGMQGDKAMLVRPDLCTYCTACEDVCPVGAIELPFLITTYSLNKDVQNETIN